jgi:hypothetical protein
MRLAGQVARMGRGQVHTGFWWGNLRERDHLDDQGVEGRFSGSGMRDMDGTDLAWDRDR